jgi:hypothetical protein
MMFAQATIDDAWSLIGNTVVGAAVIVTCFMFLKAIREQREEYIKDRNADRDDRAIERREFLDLLANLAKEIREK